PKAPRTPVARRSENTRPSLVPFLIGIAILVAGFSFLRFISKLNQIAPHPTEAAASAAPSATVTTIVAPRALPVESPARVAATAPPAKSTPTIAVPATTPIPTAIAVETPVLPAPRAVEPEV